MTFPLYLSLFHFLVKFFAYFFFFFNTLGLWIIQEHSPNGHLMRNFCLSYPLVSTLKSKLYTPFCLHTAVYVIRHCNYLIGYHFPLSNCSLHILDTVFNILRTTPMLNLWDNIIEYVLSGVNKTWSSSTLVRRRTFSSVESWTLRTILNICWRRELTGPDCQLSRESVGLHCHPCPWNMASSGSPALGPPPRT